MLFHFIIIILFYFLQCMISLVTRENACECYEMMKRCYISYSCWIALQVTVTFRSFLNMLPYWWTLFFSVLGTDYLYLGHSTLVEILQCELYKALSFLHPKTDYFSFAGWKYLTGTYLFVCHGITKGKRAAWISRVAIRQLWAWSWW